MERCWYKTTTTTQTQRWSNSNLGEHECKQQTRVKPRKKD